MMTFTPSQSCSVIVGLGDHQKAWVKPTNLSFALPETQSDSCRWSASTSTATPSEAASSHGEASPRQAEAMEELDAVRSVEVRAHVNLVESDVKDEGSTRIVGLEIDDAPLGVMFEDSDGDVCPLSPSKSARRRMRRRRQREALKAAMRDMQQEEEELEVLAVKRGDSKEPRSGPSIATLNEIDVCKATADETPQAILVTTPIHKAPCTPSVLSTNPNLDSPATATLSSSSMFRTAPLSDASNRQLPSKTNQCTTPPPDASNRRLPPMTTPCTSLGHIYLNTPSRASNRVAQGPTLTSPSLKMTSTGTTTQFLASGGCQVAASMPAVASVESWNASPEAQRAVDTLRMFLGSSAMNSRGDIVATLRAAAPEVYED